MPELTSAKIEEIKEKIEDIFTTDMEVEDYTGDTVPSIDDLPDSNKGLLITNCSILFVDIRSSTQLSDRSQAKSMAKIYRAFARAMSMCIYACGGSVRQIAGDRVMGVFVDDELESAVNKAIDTGRAILTVVEHIFNPLCKSNINNKTIQCGVGIDSGRVLTTSVGIEHDNDDSRDLVWAGKIANIASKHTDLAESGEIFVTKRFFNKLPVASKTDKDGNDIWNHYFRIKGNSIFEGYGIINYFSNCIYEGTADAAKDSLHISIAERLEENQVDGINEGQVITNIVEGVKKQTQDLLDSFETVINREYLVKEKESAYTEREKSLTVRERAIAQKESSLRDKEKQIALAVENSKNNAIYEVKLNFFKDNIDSYPLSECLLMINELKKLGEKIRKDSLTVTKEIWYWKLIRYFVQKKEFSIASNLIFEQLTNENYLVFPQADYIVTVIQHLGLEKQYLEAVKYRVETNTPKGDKLLELRNICRKLGVEHHIQKLLS
ncbi:adenylate/guanylate cyclase domain-containing protein [Metabacillus halosaccharovorans]|uniref:adenylate/guanylate cyclase domain-containing protein n=1 Tax=Metabacillus halosaccharovorans TaxID=930124 RepID=UPI00203C70ED|nr:adenylate/guanylate cyclase domain-containing protein [Metabacillus halosaccharovorans]MCM3444743.1 adenylate/guanylate cyclase domain-containing protein [Metabacillus halosaccharovorans]